MTEIERKALAWVNVIAAYPLDNVNMALTGELIAALNLAVRRIEELEATEQDCQGCDYAKPLMELQAEFEAFRREVSDEIKACLTYVSASFIKGRLGRFILPKPDPLVEAWLEAFPGNHIDDAREECAKISAALAARGLEIREKHP